MVQLAFKIEKKVKAKWKNIFNYQKEPGTESARAFTIKIEFIVQMLQYGEWVPLVFVDFDSMHKCYICTYGSNALQVYAIELSIRL